MLTVAAANALTTRWCAAEDPGRDFVVSGAGAWPLLALLASAADGPARAELEAAIGRPADGAQAEALDLLRTLDGQAVAAALGLWVRATVPLAPDWAGRLPAGVVDTLPDDLGELDAWCARQTRGLIDRLPIRIEPSALLVLATALVARTTWEFPFMPGFLRPADGPWSGHEGPSLHRVTAGLEHVAVLDGDVTRMVVSGREEVDVHLVIGAPGAAAGAVLAAGLAPTVRRAAFAVGDTAPGLRVTEQSWGHPLADRVALVVPPFAVDGHHDLCARADLFGLRTALDDSRGHFPRLSPEPLAVSQAAQDVRAAFSAEGFEAAAVTVVAMRAGAGMAGREKPVRQIEVTFDRPFGFVAVHRPSGLAIVAGWVADPA